MRGCPARSTPALTLTRRARALRPCRCLDKQAVCGDGSPPLAPPVPVGISLAPALAAARSCSSCAARRRATCPSRRASSCRPDRRSRRSSRAARRARAAAAPGRQRPSLAELLALLLLLTPPAPPLAPLAPFPSRPSPRRSPIAVNGVASKPPRRPQQRHRREGRAACPGRVAGPVCQLRRRPDNN